MKKKYFSVVFLFLVCLACLLCSENSVQVMKNILNINKMEKEQLIIVIDAGHGGRDPGKVGINNALEKDVNLSIAYKLKDLLEQNDIKIIMTREDDNGLYSETDSNRKNADLKKRVEIIQSSNAVIAVSIHQNSYEEEYVKGAQVFYHIKSPEGKLLAEIIQKQLKASIDDGNHRVAKSNSNYYMLKKTECPLVIVECGYMTNYKEAALLIDDQYQDKLAWAIHLGIMQYINQSEIKPK